MGNEGIYYSWFQYLGILTLLILGLIKYTFTNETWRLLWTETCDNIDKFVIIYLINVYSSKCGENMEILNV